MSNRPIYVVYVRFGALVTYAGEKMLGPSSKSIEEVSATLPGLEGDMFKLMSQLRRPPDSTPNAGMVSGINLVSFGLVRVHRSLCFTTHSCVTL